jgi:hypothetical protein
MSETPATEPASLGVRVMVVEGVLAILLTPRHEDHRRGTRP